MSSKKYIVAVLAIGLTGCFGAIIRNDSENGVSKVDLRFENYQKDLGQALDGAKTEGDALRAAVAIDPKSPDVQRLIVAVGAKTAAARQALNDLWSHLATDDAARLHDQHAALEASLDGADAKLRSLEESSSAASPEAASQSADQLIAEYAQAQQIHQGFDDVSVVPEFRP